MRGLPLARRFISFINATVEITLSVAGMVPIVVMFAIV